MIAQYWNMKRDVVKLKSVLCNVHGICMHIGYCIVTTCEFISADKSKEKSQEEELQKFRTGKLLQYFFLQKLDGQQITHLIFLQIWNMISIGINFYLIKEKFKYFNFKILIFFCILIRSFCLKTIGMALKWPWPSSSFYWINICPMCKNSMYIILLEPF